MNQVVHDRLQFAEAVALVIVHHQTLLEFDDRSPGRQLRTQGIEAFWCPEWLRHVDVSLQHAVPINQDGNRPVSLNESGDEGQINGSTRVRLLNDAVRFAHQVCLVPLFVPQGCKQGVRVPDQFSALKDRFRPQGHLALFLGPQRPRNPSTGPQRQAHDGRCAEEQKKPAVSLLLEGHGGVDVEIQVVGMSTFSGMNVKTPTQGRRFGDSKRAQANLVK